MMSLQSGESGFDDPSEKGSMPLHKHTTYTYKSSSPLLFSITGISHHSNLSLLLLFLSFSLSLYYHLCLHKFHKQVTSNHQRNCGTNRWKSITSSSSSRSQDFKSYDYWEIVLFTKQLYRFILLRSTLFSLRTPI
jgi:hypothetical protein